MCDVSWRFLLQRLRFDIEQVFFYCFILVFILRQQKTVHVHVVESSPSADRWQINKPEQSSWVQMKKKWVSIHLFSNEQSGNSRKSDGYKLWCFLCFPQLETWTWTLLETHNNLNISSHRFSFWMQTCYRETTRWTVCENKNENQYWTNM